MHGYRLKNDWLRIAEQCVTKIPEKNPRFRHGAPAGRERTSGPLALPCFMACQADLATKGPPCCYRHLTQDLPQSDQAGDEITRLPHLVTSRSPVSLEAQSRHNARTCQRAAMVRYIGLKPGSGRPGCSAISRNWRLIHKAVHAVSPALLKREINTPRPACKSSSSSYGQTVSGLVDCVLMIIAR